MKRGHMAKAKAIGERAFKEMGVYQRELQPGVSLVLYHDQLDELDEYPTNDGCLESHVFSLAIALGWEVVGIL